MRVWGALLAALAIGLLAAAGPPTAAARDYDCADFSSQAEAQEYLLPGDPYNLDADSDGIACESNPCPCAGEAGGGRHGHKPPPPPPPYRLTKAAARHAAVVVAKKFVRRNARVSRAAVGSCHRLGERRVDCFAVATGRTAGSPTSCQLRIAVRARNRQPQARLARASCRTRSSARAVTRVNRT